MHALIEGHQAVDAAKEVAAMVATRVGVNASADEAKAWVDRKARKSRSEPSKPSVADQIAARRASLEALGFRVVDQP